jgi:serine/threonine protein kinase
MDRVRWQRLEQLFDEALALAPEGRAEFISKACGDDANMRRELESLLAHEEASGPYLEQAIRRAAAGLAGPKGASLQDSWITPRLGIALAGRYEVERELARGGMAIVFRARDRKHDRAVALKVLNPDVAGLVNRQRFLEEIRLAARLAHPHILPLYDSGEADGLLFYVMPEVQGATLADRLEHRSRCDVAEVLVVARGVAAALDYAHRNDVVHRDIKPANILLHDDMPVVADFGIARALKAGGFGDRLTQSGALLGTPLYMSPEQTTGDRAVDARSDIYSLGIVLFEMLCGVPPIAGESFQETIALRLTQDPPLISSLRGGLPTAVDRVFQRVLARAPRDRYQSARAFLEALEAAFVGEVVAAPRPTRAAIAVLPFVNRTGQSDDEFLSDGISEQLINALSRIEGLRVVARTSSFAFKGQDVDVRTIGRRLDVSAALEGSVARAGRRLRITTQLVDVADGFDLWSELYDRELDDVFAVQDDIVHSIVSVLRDRLLGSPRVVGGTVDAHANAVPTSFEAPAVRRLEDRSIPDLRAYEYYLRARHEIFQFTQDALERAVEFLERGIDILGDNVTLLSALGYAHWQRVNAGFASDTSSLDEAERCAERIAARDPESPHGYRLRGLVAIHRGDPLAAVRNLRRSLDDDPNDVDSLFWISLLYGFLGVPRLALPLVDRLISIDPLTALHQMLPGFVRLMQGRFADAIDPFAMALSMEPGNPILRIGYAQVQAMAGQASAAIETLAPFGSPPDESFFGRVGRFYAGSLRDDAAAPSLIDEEVQTTAERDFQYCWILAQGYALLGESTVAISWLGRALAQGCSNHPLLARWDPLLAPARTEPAFAELMRGLEPKWRELTQTLEGGVL